MAVLRTIIAVTVLLVLMVMQSTASSSLQPVNSFRCSRTPDGLLSRSSSDGSMEVINNCIYSTVSSLCGVPKSFVDIKWQYTRKNDTYAIVVSIFEETAGERDFSELSQAIMDAFRERFDGHSDEASTCDEGSRLTVEAKPYSFEIEECVDSQGAIVFAKVPWLILNGWLSFGNGNAAHSELTIPQFDLNYEEVIHELEERRKWNTKSSDLQRREYHFVSSHVFGYTKDWREYENDQGYTHLEELLIHQPRRWHIQAREYLFVYKFDLMRESSSTDIRSRQIEIETKEGSAFTVNIAMLTPLMTVMFHQSLNSLHRYTPLNFLLSYGAANPLPVLLTKLKLDPDEEEAFLTHISPLDYFLHFADKVSVYKADILAEVADATKRPRLRFLNELDFLTIVGQRLAKGMIREQIVTHFWDRNREKTGSSSRSPLSMVFAGPSGNGKTELAQMIAEILNRSDDTTFLKVDCGMMQHSTEIFGLSGAYRGAEQGSALNNFIVRMSRDSSRIGVVLLDEFDKSQPEVLEGFYQVLDKGEWTNKQLQGSSGSQTSVVSCENIIFIMTVNSADSKIEQYTKTAPEVYTGSQQAIRLHQRHLGRMIQTHLQQTHPFTKAFIGRIDAFVPFLPMSAKTSDDYDDTLQLEMATITKILLEQEMQNLEMGRDALQVTHTVSPLDNDNMANLILSMANPDSGVRSIQRSVRKEISKRLMHEYLLAGGSISRGSEIRYAVDKEEESISFRTVSSDSSTVNSVGEVSEDQTTTTAKDGSGRDE